MVTKVGELYVGRLPQIQRGVANIHFAIHEMKKVQPNADYEKVTMVGHSMGGDISMYFAKEYPDEIKKVVTLDNLRVPFLTDGKFKILSFRSKDTHFKPDPGVVPDDEQCEQAGITVVNTGFQHNDMRDTGPDAAKSSIQSMLDKFLERVRQERRVEARADQGARHPDQQPGTGAAVRPVGQQSGAEQVGRRTRRPRRPALRLRHDPAH